MPGVFLWQIKTYSFWNLYIQTEEACNITDFLLLLLLLIFVFETRSHCIALYDLEITI